MSSEVSKTKRKPTGAAAMGPGPGRPKGVPNKVTVEFRETVRQLLDDNRENVGRWLTLVAEGDGTDRGRPAAPKLGRVEHVGEGGGPVRFSLDKKDAEA
jgi:hypothetical protein